MDDKAKNYTGNRISEQKAFMSNCNFELKRDTRVLFYLRDREEYLMTNEDGEISSRLRIFAIDKNGNITMKGYLLGSILNHEPEIVEEMELMNCTYEKLNPNNGK